MPGHDLGWTDSSTSLRNVVRNLRQLPLTADIRTRWQYCNLMFMTVSLVVEKWTNMWLGDFLRTRIYKPLGMTSTFFSLQDALEGEGSGGASLASGYQWNNYTKKYIAVPWMDDPRISGAGATISNVLDFTKWLRCHMRASAPISSTGHSAIHAPRIFTGNLWNETMGFRGADAYALGWFISNYRGETMIWHPGGLPGFTTMMLYFPRLQWGLTMMANEVGRALLIPVFKLLDDVLNIPEEERFDTTSAINSIEAHALRTLRDGRDILYPNAPKGKNAIPFSLPLESYTGVGFLCKRPHFVLWQVNRHTLTMRIPHLPWASTRALFLILTRPQRYSALWMTKRSGQSPLLSNTLVENTFWCMRARIPTSESSSRPHFWPGQICDSVRNETSQSFCRPSTFFSHWYLSSNYWLLNHSEPEKPRTTTTSTPTSWPKLNFGLGKTAPWKVSE